MNWINNVGVNEVKYIKIKLFYFCSEFCLHLNFAKLDSEIVLFVFKIFIQIKQEGIGWAIRSNRMNFVILKVKMSLKC